MRELEEDRDQRSSPTRSGSDAERRRAHVASPAPASIAEPTRRPGDVGAGGGPASARRLHHGVMALARRHAGDLGRHAGGDRLDDLLLRRLRPCRTPATLRPSRSTVMRSATSKTSCMLCEIRTTARPCSASRRTRSSTWRVWATPSAAVGSSRITSCEFHRRPWRPRPTGAGRPRGSRPAGGSSGSSSRTRLLSVSRRALLHRRLVEPARARRAPRGRGTCSGRRRGCRTARGPGRRPRCRAAPRPSGREIDTGGPSKRISPASIGWMPGDALDQRRLAGAVVADEGHDLAGADVRSRRPSSACTAPKRLEMPAQFERRRTVVAHRVHRSTCACAGTRGAPTGAARRPSALGRAAPTCRASRTRRGRRRTS